MTCGQACRCQKLPNVKIKVVKFKPVTRMMEFPLRWVSRLSISGPLIWWPSDRLKSNADNFLRGFNACWLLYVMGICLCRLRSNLMWLYIKRCAHIYSWDVGILAGLLLNGINVFGYGEVASGSMTTNSQSCYHKSSDRHDFSIVDSSTVDRRIPIYNWYLALL